MNQLQNTILLSRRISLCIVWLFIFCHFWKLIPTLYEGISYHNSSGSSSSSKGSSGSVGRWPEWLSAVNDLSHTLIVFNSAVNFLIYAWL